MLKSQFVKVASFLTLLVAISCKKETVMVGKDPNTAEKVSIDRFSATSGKLMVRDASNGLPLANAAVNFDVAPFITKGLGPTGQIVEYYNFDVQSKTAIPIYVLFRDGETTPVTGQLNIIEAIPGDSGYSDFWLVQKVTVPKTYVANYVTSLAEIQKEGYTITATTTIVNCPVVPAGSTATKRIGGGSAALMQGWYKSKLVQYFSFEEKALTAVNGMVPTSPIYVTFKINPNLPNGGAASGFVTQTGTAQTHNVLATVPSSTGYSPLWSVNVYDNAKFGSVSNLATAQAATILATGVANVNCPVVTQ
jgi:hypothetical protein